MLHGILKGVLSLVSALGLAIWLNIEEVYILGPLPVLWAKPKPEQALHHPLTKW